MKFEINKCKNHVNISDGVPDNVGGFRAYGLEAQGVKYLLSLPRLFWHQVICPDNPTLHQLSNWIEKTYKPMTYKEELEQKMEIKQQIVIKKTETLLP